MPLNVKLLITNLYLYKFYVVRFEEFSFSFISIRHLSNILNYCERKVQIQFVIFSFNCEQLLLLFHGLSKQKESVINEPIGVKWVRNCVVWGAEVGRFTRLSIARRKRHLSEGTVIWIYASDSIDCARISPRDLSNSLSESHNNWR